MYVYVFHLNYIRIIHNYRYLWSFFIVLMQDFILNDSKYVHLFKNQKNKNEIQRDFFI